MRVLVSRSFLDVLSFFLFLHLFPIEMTSTSELIPPQTTSPGPSCNTNPNPKPKPTSNSSSQALTRALNDHFIPLLVAAILLICIVSSQLLSSLREDSIPTISSLSPSLTLLSNTSGAAICGCATDSDCGTSQVCASDPQHPGCNACKHKPLFPNFDVYDVIGTILSIFLCALAAGGGIGGGGLLVPIFILFVNFAPQPAVALSKVS